MGDRRLTGVPRATRIARGVALVSGLLAGLLVGPAQNVTADASSRPAPAQAVSTQYRLLHNGDGSAVRWNPCASVHYRVNLTWAPPGALADVRTAVARVSKATGIRFVEDGTTSVVPQRTYGADAAPWQGRVPPLVIAWAAPGKGRGHTDALTGSGDELGVGGWRTAWWTDAHGAHRPRIVTGYVVVNSRANAQLRGGFSRAGRGSVLLHELGHVMGLDHVSDQGQLMYPRMTARSGFGAGDLTGLKRVGRPAGCLA